MSPEVLTETKLNRIAWLSAKDVQSLKDGYHQLTGKTAVGIDGMIMMRSGKRMIYLEPSALIGHAGF